MSCQHYNLFMILSDRQTHGFIANSIEAGILLGGNRILSWYIESWLKNTPNFEAFIKKTFLKVDL